MPAMPDEAPSACGETGRQGIVVDAAEPELLRRAVEMALDYRGDVTITRCSGESIEGYVFDRTDGPAPTDAAIRMIPRDRDERITVRCDDIARIHFTGRDTAAGKSFESWMKKYVAKKLAGERADLESEPLDEG
jgi:hypothetical protein